MSNQLDELIALRVSVARIAQTLCVDNELQVTDMNYASLYSLARSVARGWNDLAGLIQEKCQKIMED